MTKQKRDSGEMMAATENSTLKTRSSVCNGCHWIVTQLRGGAMMLGHAGAPRRSPRHRRHGSFLSPPSLHGNILRDIGFAPAAVRFAKRNLARVERDDV